jgi:hypothetical protein
LVAETGAAAIRFSSRKRRRTPVRLENLLVASLHLDEASGKYRIRFYYGGAEFKRSLKTGDEKEARAVKGRVEETIGCWSVVGWNFPPGPTPPASSSRTAR